MAYVLFTRRGCHLCEQAEEMLESLCPGLVLIDVDASEEHAAAYGRRVPVLERDGVVVMEGRFDQELLARRLS